MCVCVLVHNICFVDKSIMNELMNECLTTPHLKMAIGYQTNVKLNK